jgi:hypothetical protein
MFRFAASEHLSLTRFRWRGGTKNHAGTKATKDVLSRSFFVRFESASLRAARSATVTSEHRHEETHPANGNAPKSIKSHPCTLGPSGTT